MWKLAWEGKVQNVGLHKEATSPHRAHFNRQLRTRRWRNRYFFNRIKNAVTCARVIIFARRVQMPILRLNSPWPHTWWHLRTNSFLTQHTRTFLWYYYIYRNKFEYDIVSFLWYYYVYRVVNKFEYINWLQLSNCLLDMLYLYWWNRWTLK